MSPNSGSQSSGSGADSPEETSENHRSGGGSSRGSKRRKVDHACVYCRRSHMTCDSQRPCSRCVKRNIGHLCRDESKEGSPGAQQQPIKEEKGGEGKAGGQQNIGAPLSIDESTHASPEEWASILGGSTNLLTNLTPYQQPLFYSEGAGSEFSSLNDFLTMIEDIPPAVSNKNGEKSRGLMEAPTPTVSENVVFRSSLPEIGAEQEEVEEPEHQQEQHNPLSARANGNLTLTTATTPIHMPETAKDKFFLTAADPADGPGRTPEERLKQVINAKLEAGLLAPYNYVKGYARLQRYMDRHMAPGSRQRILKPLSIFRPAFRAIAQTLIDVDLVLVEEAFERMLLDYDRVFTSMAIPACLWRRTGEIYRGNKEFAALVEVPVEELRDGKIAIYEVLSEDSVVNYWEKYGNIAFDSGQKAVLTSCTLKSRDGQTQRQCCFSFTIRRDRYNIPSCIIGNFIPIHN
ncbi:zinc cluster transcriptional activator [Myxozyma melibiosi]|uniref:Zinc cluster transcriptional activator n=1 Tax=Myxozyma melibiosi TaxID=54550 RepID=A0ABR1FC59_9ASCO